MIKGLRVAVAALLVASVVAAVVRSEGGTDAVVATEAPTTRASTSTTAVATTTTTLPAPTTTVAPPPPPPTTAPRPATTRAPRPAARQQAPAVARAAPVPMPTGPLSEYRGLGAWLDVFDWSLAYTNGNPGAGVAQIDHMADLGVQTLYIQASRHDSPSDVQEPERLRSLIDRAHQRGMRVVAWYLPTFEDTGRDLVRLLELAKLPVESIAVDIESTKVADPNERSRRLLNLSSELRRLTPGRSLGAIVLPPVVLEVINGNYWPGFPWRELVPFYDVWLPMDYWTYRKVESGYRDAYRYTAENIDRLRRNVGFPAPVHPIGGIGDKTTVADLDGFHRASVERGVLGGSIYDYRTTAPDHWPQLQRFR
jgi:hypothetical protein